MTTLREENLCIVVVDIVGSTRTLVDARINGESTSSCISIEETKLRLVEELRRMGSGFQKDTGDGLISTFSDPLKAFHALQALRTVGTDGTIPFALRSGGHVGTVAVKPDGDIVGADASLAFRIADVAASGQCVASDAFAAQVRPYVKGQSFFPLGSRRLKGFEESEVRLWSVFDQSSNAAAHCQITSEQPVGPVKDLPPAARSERSSYPGLPPRTAELIGRDAEKKELIRDIEAERLITVTGAGGVGKTSLVIDVAHEVLSQFPDGISMVFLAPVTSPMLVGPTIANTLGVTEGESAIAAFLRGKHMLLIIDNFEHVITRAPLVRELLDACPDLKIFVTSREPLRLTGETVFELAPLELPSEHATGGVERWLANPSVQLFMRCAKEDNVELPVDQETLVTIAAICRKLEGIPLSIELAAAWLKTLPPAEILTRLESRLKFLTLGKRDQGPRHLTLRDTIAWSYDLLTEEEKSVFAQLAVFRGGCWLNAAEAVCVVEGHSTLAVLTELVSKNLVRRVQRPTSGGRYSMLETIAEFSYEKFAGLSGREPLRKRHAEYFRDSDAKYEEPDNLLASQEYFRATGDMSSVTAIAQVLAQYSYHFGGPMPLNSPGYVRRQADEDLFERLLRGKHCILTSPCKFGKTSLLIRVSDRFLRQGIGTAFVYLAGIGTQITEELWNYEILHAILRGLEAWLPPDVRETIWVEEEAARSHELRSLLKKHVLPFVPGRLVLFIDEIHMLPHFEFNAEQRLYELINLEPLKLTVCFAGVDPGGLWTRPQLKFVTLGNFTETEATATLTAGLGRNPEDTKRLIERVFYWTSGHPYLTSRLCKAIASDVRISQPSDVDDLCRRLYLDTHARHTDIMVTSTGEALLRYTSNDMLALYRTVLRHRVIMDPDNAYHQALISTGIAREENKRLVVNNRIFKTIFSEQWVADKSRKPVVNLLSGMLRGWVGQIGAWFGRGSGA